MIREYTHPDVLTRGVREGWAEPISDPTRIDWESRLAKAAIPFPIIDGRPKNPFGPTGIRYGRNELGHWGEAQAADAVVTADFDGDRWLAMVARGDGHGWALPGGFVDDDETPTQAAARELLEETGLAIDGADWEVLSTRYVPDPRASDEAWMVTTPVRVHLGLQEPLPFLVGGDDARYARWIWARDYASLVRHLSIVYGGTVFAAHRPMLAELLG